MGGMQDSEIEDTETTGGGLAGKISGAGQAILGEIERLAGVINADPLAQEEGEFNVEVGEIREEIEAELDHPDAEAERT